MSKPLTLTTNSFDQWRQNTNTVSNNVGDPASLYATRGGGDNTVITQPTDVVVALNDQNTRKFNLTGGTVTGATTFSSTLDVTGDFKVNTNKLIVTAASGNTTVAGTLGVTGITTLSSTANVVGDFSVNTNKFNVTAATGNTTVAGTLGVTGTTGLAAVNISGDVAVATNKFNVASATGNTTVAGTLGVTGDVAINTNKFNITATSGNTLIAGTLGVTGLITASGGLSGAVTSSNATLSGGTVNGMIIGGTTPAAATVTTLTANTSVSSDSISSRQTDTDLTLTANGTGKVNVNDLLNVVGDFSVATNKFNVTATTGNTTVAGTLTVTGSVDFGAIVSNSVTSKSTDTDLTLAGNGTGKVNVNDPLNTVGDFSVATNKFNVAATTGNTTVAGTLGVTGVTTSGGIASDTVTAKTLDTDLTLSGNGTGKVNINDPLNVVSDLSVATNKFTVASATGNTVVGGVLSVTGTTKTAANFYAGTSDPTNTNRLNFDGYLYGTKFYGDGGGLTNLVTTLNIGVDADSTHVSVPILDDRLILRGSSGVTLSYNNTEKSITFTATGTTSSSDINDNARVGKHLSVGTWTGAALQTIDTAQAVEIRPWNGSTLTNLLKVASTNDGATTVFRIAAAGAVYASGIQNFSNNTASTSTTSGAVIVTGGIGVGGAIYTGGLISVEDNVFLDTNTVTGQNAQTIFSSDQDAMDVTVRCTKGTSYQFTKLLIVHNGTDSWVTEYGTVSNTTPFVTFSTSIAGGILSLVANGGGTTNTVYKVYATVFKD